MNRDISFHAQWLALLKSHAIFFSQLKAKVKLVDFLVSSRLEWNEHVFETRSRTLASISCLTWESHFSFAVASWYRLPLWSYILLCFIVSQQAARPCASRGDGPSRFTRVMEINHRLKDLLTCKTKWLIINFCIDPRWSASSNLLGAISRLHFAVLWQPLNPIIHKLFGNNWGKNHFVCPFLWMSQIL